MGNYYLYKIASFIVRSVPLSVAYVLSRFLADCHYILAKADRRAVANNIRVVQGKKEVTPAMVRGVFHNFGKYLVDFFVQTKRVTPAFIQEKIRITNGQVINEVLKKGKGCIIVGAHIGNWEMAGAVLGSLGYPVSVVALPHRDPRVNAFFNAQREFFNVEVIPTSIAIRRVMEQLRHNRIVALLGERDFNDHGIEMDFLGKPTRIPKGSAVFSLKTGAPIITGFFLRGPDDSYDIILREPIVPPAVAAGRLDDQLIQQTIEQYIRPIEEQIRRHPTQWLMFRQFWI